MNREERFQKKVTKIVMISLVAVFLIVIAAVIYHFASPGADTGDSVVFQKEKKVLPVLDFWLVIAEIIDSTVSVVFGAVVFLSITFIALWAAHYLPFILRSMASPIVWLIVLFMRKIGWFEGPRAEVRVTPPYNPVFSGLLKLSRFLYSKKTYSEVFEPIVADLEDELYEALKDHDLRKAERINVTYVYALLSTIVERSPIGDFIEFIRKIAK